MGGVETLEVDRALKTEDTLTRDTYHLNLYSKQMAKLRRGNLEPLIRELNQGISKSREKSEICTQIPWQQGAPP